MTKKGTNSLITMDTATGKEYLHVFNLVFAKPPVLIENDGIEDSSRFYTDSTELLEHRFTMNGTFVADYDFDANHIQEAGVVYSDKYELEVGFPGVEKAPGTFENSAFSVTVVRGADCFVRAYVKADNKYYYSDTILSWVVPAGADHGTAGTPVSIDNLFGTTGSYNQTINPGCSARVGNTRYFAGETIPLNTDGNYYIINTWSNGSQSVTHAVIDKTPPTVSGIQNYGVYNSAVRPVCGEWNVLFYLAKDNLGERDFAEGIAIGENGYYRLKAIDSVGNVTELFFQITPPVVTTVDCFSTTTHSAEVSANFTNNGAVLARGFVYSTIDNDPRTGKAGCTTFIPAEDPEPAFLTTTLTGLAINSRHFFRAFVQTGDAGNPVTTYGEVKEFTTANDDILRGDVNHSGSVELADAVLTLQILSGVIPAQEVFKDADVNGDGRLGLPEVLYILQTIAGRRM
jgi:hypothetical protein